MSERSFDHLAREKLEHMRTEWDSDGPSMIFESRGWYEDRDPQGSNVHWRWLLWKWTVLADKLLAEESRGVYDQRTLD